MTDDRAEPADAPPDPWLVDRLMSQDSTFRGSDPVVAAMSEIVGALRAPGSPAELAGESAALTAFEAAGVRRPARRRASRVAILGATVGGKIALSAAVAAAATVVAAYAGVLPAPLQSLAHRAIHAPAPHHSNPAGPGASPSAGGQPRATTGAGSTASPEPSDRASTRASTVPSSALPGLCHAYEKATNAHDSAAFRKLAQVAGGASQVGSFCARVEAHPPKPSAGGHGAHGSPSPPGASHGHGKPSTSPSHGNNGNSKPLPTHSPGKPAIHTGKLQMKSQRKS